MGINVNDCGIVKWRNGERPLAFKRRTNLVNAWDRSPLPNPCKVPGNHEALYISMAGIHGRKALHDNDSFDEYWKKEVGYTWYQIVPTSLLMRHKSSTAIVFHSFGVC
jgi:hypothetical protein